MDTGNENKIRAVDISSEMAEGFALPLLGVGLEVIETLVLPNTKEKFHYRHGLPRFDADVLPYISSVSLSCGLHSGDPVLLRRVIPTLTEKGIRIGAHPSYPDVFRFGQYRMALNRAELEAVLLYQLGALGGVLRAYGEVIQHVKCHGALQFDVSYEAPIFDVLAAVVKKFDPSIIIVLLAGSPCVKQGDRLGIRVVEEGFIDRGYDQNGRLVPRNHPKALLTDPAQAADQLMQIVLDGEVTSVEGTKVPINAKTFCMHSDTPGAGAIAKAVDEALRAQGVDRRSLAEIFTHD